MLDERKTIPQVARDLDLTMSALRRWVERARADRTHGRTGLTTAESCLDGGVAPECAASAFIEEGSRTDHSFRSPPS